MNFLKRFVKPRQPDPFIAKLDALKVWRETRAYIEQPNTYGPQCPKCQGWNTGPGEVEMATGKTTCEFRCFSCYHGWGASGVQVARPINMADYCLAMQYYAQTVMPAEITVPKEAQDAWKRCRESYYDMNENVK